MKLDYSYIDLMEKENGVVLLSRIKEKDPYYYYKVKKLRPDLVLYLEVKTARGKSHFSPFIRIDDLEMLKSKKKKEKVSRAFIGRPYSFCKDCPSKSFCSEKILCEKRNEKLKEKESAKTRNKDSRFWKKGSPKKHLILCKFSKYIYAHKKQAGICQKEKCQFYNKGKCDLGIDKQ